MSLRPAKPTISQIREISQPTSVRGRKNSEHWVADLYLRKISPYLTSVILKSPLTANGVTVLMIITGVSSGFALLIPGVLGLILALFLSQLQMLWDCCDGEIARWRETQSPKGVFLDRLGHYLTEGFLPIALALRILNWPKSEITNYRLLFVASLISLLILLNKAFNDSVHVARAYAGLSKLADSKSVGEAKSTIIKLAKAPFKVLAIQRLFHSVEMTILIVLFQGSQKLIDIGFYVLIFVTVGHLISILNSKKLEG